MKKILIIIICFCGAANVYSAEKIYSPTFTGNFILYILDRDSVAGWVGPLMKREKTYMPQKYQDLPVLGGWWEVPIDREVLIKDGIKKAVVLEADPENPDKRVEDLKKLGLEVKIVKAATIDDYPALMRELGAYLGVPERGEALALFGERMLEATRQMVKDLPESDRKRVYIAHGPKGLNTMCYLDALELSRSVNATECPAGGYASVDLEAIMKADPDVIIITNPSGSIVMNDPQWARLRAAREGRMYIVPYGPFGWMHMPEVTRFMGAPWLACTLYPDRCKVDLAKETKTFMSLFMYTDLDEAGVKKILEPIVDSKF